MQYGRLKDGRPSRYMLAIGFQEQVTTKNGGKVQMWYEHEHYHVRALSISNRHIIWESFMSWELSKARTEFSRVIRQINKGVLY